MKFNKKEITFIKQIIAKLETKWFKPYDIFAHLIPEDTPWGYPTNLYVNKTVYTFKII